MPAQPQTLKPLNPKPRTLNTKPKGNAECGSLEASRPHPSEGLGPAYGFRVLGHEYPQKNKESNGEDRSG